MPPPGQLPFGGDKAGLSFLDTMTGWITGSFPLNGYVFFYVTHDGGATWNRQPVPFSPDQASTQIATRPPRFFTATDGILLVSFVTETASSLDLYVTHDGGVSRRPLQLFHARAQRLGRGHSVTGILILLVGK